jgi:hypothetical protein
MLLTRHSEVRLRCEQAVAVARQVGDRVVEGHALTTLGTSLGALGDVEAGIADLEQGRQITWEFGNIDDICRLHANLATVFELSGRAAEAVDVYLAGADAARKFGTLGGSGTVLLPDAASALPPRALRRGRAAAGRGLRPGPPLARAPGPPADRTGDAAAAAGRPRRRAGGPAGSLTTPPRRWTRSPPRRCSRVWPRRPSGTAACQTRAPRSPTGWRSSPGPRSPTGSPSCAAPGWRSRPRSASTPARATPMPTSGPPASWQPV